MGGTNRWNVNRWTALALAALGAFSGAGCAASQPTSRATGMFFPVMSPARSTAIALAEQPRSQASSSHMEFLPMFAAAGSSSFRPVELEFRPVVVASAPIEFFPMFASVNGPSRWSASLELGDLAIVAKPAAKPAENSAADADQPLAGVEAEKNPR